MGTLCIWHLQYFQSFRNFCLFCTYWLIRNFYSGEANHANYGKHSLNHHLLHCAHFVYEIYSVFKFSKWLVFFCTLLLIRNFYSGHEQNVKYGKHSLNHHFQYCAHCVYEIYIVFKVFEMAAFFCTFWLIRNLNCADSDHTSYGERCSIHHFKHCAQCVY